MSKPTGIEQLTGKQLHTPAEIVCEQVRLARTRKPFPPAAQVWFKRTVSEQIAAEPNAPVKRNIKLTVCLTESEKRDLRTLASKLRMDPGHFARNIVLDFLEGKLVPASAEKPA